MPATEAGVSPAERFGMRWLAPIVAASLCTACVHPVELDSAIAPSRSVANRSADKAGVVCDENLLGHVERAHPNTLTGLATTYEIELGEPLCDALFRSVQSSYRAALRATKPYYEGQYGRVVEFELHNSALSIAKRPDGSTRVAFTVSVVVERYGRDLRPLSRNVVTGNGLIDRQRVTAEVVSEAVEAALRQIADEATRLLVARLDGPRVPAARKR